MCLFIVAGQGSSGLPPSVMYLILFTFANYTYHGEDLKNSPTVNSVRQTLDIEKFCSILIRFCILSDPPPSIYTCDLLSSYSVMNTPNKTCWEKIRGGEIEKEKKSNLFSKRNLWLSHLKREALGIARHYHTISDSLTCKWLMVSLRELLPLSAHTPQMASAVTAIKAGDLSIKEQDFRWENGRKLLRD